MDELREYPEWDVLTDRFVPDLSHSTHGENIESWPYFNYWEILPTQVSITGRLDADFSDAAQSSAPCPHIGESAAIPEIPQASTASPFQRLNTDILYLILELVLAREELPPDTSIGGLPDIFESKLAVYVLSEGKKRGKEAKQIPRMCKGMKAYEYRIVNYEFDTNALFVSWQWYLIGRSVLKAHFRKQQQLPRKKPNSGESWLFATHFTHRTADDAAIDDESTPLLCPPLVHMALRPGGQLFSWLFYMSEDWNYTSDKLRFDKLIRMLDVRSLDIYLPPPTVIYGSRPICYHRQGQHNLDRTLLTIFHILSQQPELAADMPGLNHAQYSTISVFQPGLPSYSKIATAQTRSFLAWLRRIMPESKGWNSSETDGRRRWWEQKRMDVSFLGSPWDREARMNYHTRRNIMNQCKDPPVCLCASDKLDFMKYKKTQGLGIWDFKGDSMQCAFVDNNFLARVHY